MTEPGLAAGLARARALLAEAERVLVLTGAGISADSGVPTFRGPGGLWKDFRPEDLATPEAFERDPRLVWEWYGWRREVVSGCRPNAAHVSLARWQARAPGRIRIATQNVDGLHSLAAVEGSTDGTTDPSADLAEVHGTLFGSRCNGCGLRFTDRATVDATAIGTLPACASCDSLLRPDVVWYGEALDPAVIELAFRWAAEADACLVIGTSALVHPAASLPSVTRENGGSIVEVNPEATPLTAHATVSLRGGAAATVPSIVPLPPTTPITADSP